MPAQWTGRFVGDVHNAGLTIKSVAEEAGMNAKYISQIINSEAENPKAEAKLRAALDRLVSERRDSVSQ